MAVAAQGLSTTVDPRMSEEVDAIASYPNRVLTTLHDPNVTFEEYLYYASISRSEEARLYGKNNFSVSDNGPTRRFHLARLGGDEKTRAVETATRPTSRDAAANGPSPPAEVVEAPAATAPVFALPYPAPVESEDRIEPVDAARHVRPAQHVDPVGPAELPDAVEAARQIHPTGHGEAGQHLEPELASRLTDPAEIPLPAEVPAHVDGGEAGENGDNAEFVDAESLSDKVTMTADDDIRADPVAPLSTETHAVEAPATQSAGSMDQATFHEAVLEKLALEKSAVEVKAVDGSSDPSQNLAPVTDQEWVQASRAARTATWGAVFYLITTDILGPTSVPWAMSQLGYGPGIALYTVFGALAGYTGYQIWQMFLGLDSDRYPLKNYGDIAYRIFGQWARYTCNVLQSLQFFLNVAILIISNGQAISQLSQGTLCFIICLVIFVIAGFSLGQVRTLAKFGYIANLAVWMNLLVIFLTMGVVANSEPNYKAVAASYPNVLPDPDHPGPIVHTIGTPDGLSFTNNINGLMQAVFSYGGATLFCEFLAEMRRPYDFWKGLICAEIVIYVAYMLFGLFVYAYQGQYAYNPANQGITPFAFQTAGNVLGLVSALIAACMYGNIGIKVLYANVGRELLNFPALETRRGKLIWIGLVPVYWILAFAIGAAIPQISNFSSLVGAACILQFTYTFPPILMLGFKAQRDAMLPDEVFDPQTGRVTRKDGGMQRWMRGLRKHWMINLWDFVFAVGSAATAVLGIYASVVLLIKGYQDNPSQAAFSCKSPSG